MERADAAGRLRRSPLFVCRLVSGLLGATEYRRNRFCLRRSGFEGVEFRVTDLLDERLLIDVEVALLVEQLTELREVHERGGVSTSVA